MFRFSSVEINENGPVTGTIAPDTWVSRTFRLPATYQRGDRLPEITGLQFCHDISDEENFAVDFRLELTLTTGPLLVQEGSISGADTTGTYIWSDIYFQEPVKVDPSWLVLDFTVSVKSATPTWTTADGIRFRLLAATADSGEDFLGNKYRSIAVRNAPDKFDTRLDLTDTYWLSKPNPSKFAVESLYFDMRNFEGRASAVDRLLLDPITPGVLFHIYFSDQGEPGTTDEEWEDRLWSPVTYTFRADRRQEHAMPAPVVGKYLKIEFSQLQARYYSPGTFHQSINYKKHPKWVLDYFLARTIDEAVTGDPYTARRVGVTFDAFELGYDYYLDDLKQDPTHPEVLSPDATFSTFMADRQDRSDKIDVDTMSRIKLSLEPYKSPPGQLGNGLTYLPALYSEVSEATGNYPVERVTKAVADTTQVSNANRSSLVIEHTAPAMFFYLTARHKYREVAASFEEDRAYFVGIRELAFTRDVYSVAYDNDLYVETLTDSTNVIRNDFLEEGYPPAKPVKH